MPVVRDRIDVTFPSGDSYCAAWWYRPDRTDPGPAIVLGHGLGAVKEMGLDDYAARFTAAGYTCLVFDYRHFGASGGHPRQLLDIDRQLTDFAAAVTYTRTVDGVDPDRVAVFGSSFGAGHALVTAARDTRIAAVIAQTPFTSGSASCAVLGVTLLKVSALAVGDLLARLTGRAPVLVPLAGAPGATALMNAPDARDGFLRLVPDGYDFTNAVAARVATRIPFHHPGRAARKIQCPILFGISNHDSVAPAKQSLHYARQAPHAEIVRYDFGHFDVYTGPPFEQAVTDQLAFLERHLPS